MSISAKSVGAARFKAECLRLIEQMEHDRQPVTITRRGRPVAILEPVPAPSRPGIVGALRGSVLRFDDPFTPAAADEDWNSGP